jgi:hypothetical protein
MSAPAPIASCIFTHDHFLQAIFRQLRFFAEKSNHCHSERSEESAFLFLLCALRVSAPSALNSFFFLPLVYEFAVVAAAFRGGRLCFFSPLACPDPVGAPRHSSLLPLKENLPS